MRVGVKIGLGVAAKTTRKLTRKEIIKEGAKGTIALGIGAYSAKYGKLKIDRIAAAGDKSGVINSFINIKKWFKKTTGVV